MMTRNYPAGSMSSDGIHSLGPNVTLITLNTEGKTASKLNLQGSIRYLLAYGWLFFVFCFFFIFKVRLNIIG